MELNFSERTRKFWSDKDIHITKKTKSLLLGLIDGIWEEPAINHQPAYSAATHQRLNMELDIQSYLGFCVQLYSLATPPPPRIWAQMRRRYWSAKIDDFSLWLIATKIPFMHRV